MDQTAKRNVLFVDDEDEALIALRDLLEPVCDNWEMRFALGGEEALNIMDQLPVSILVTDLQMPGMDGARLLAETRRRHPETARVIMSGHYDRETALRLACSTHQYLPKPCDPNKLGTIIKRICRLRDMLASDTLQRLVARVKSLPSLPDVYMELMDELEKDDPELEQIGKIISRDPGMSAKILQLTNSAYFGLPREVTHPSEATMFLGVDMIRGLVLMAHVFTQFDKVKIEAFSIEKMMEHSWLTGVFARQICEMESNDPKTSDFAFIAGLLHDIGKLILVANLPELYWEVTQAVEKRKIGCSDAEEDVIGCNHAEIGAYLLGLWGLPDPVVEAVAFHNRPGQYEEKGFNPAVAVNIASEIEKLKGLTQHSNPFPDGLKNQYRHLGLEERLEGWWNACQKILHKNE